MQADSAEPGRTLQASASEAVMIRYNGMWVIVERPRESSPNVRFARVSSIGQCNTSCSLLAGVSKAKVFRGR
jgi:hypothetical protein